MVRPPKVDMVNEDLGKQQKVAIIHQVSETVAHSSVTPHLNVSTLPHTLTVLLHLFLIIFY